MVTTDSTLALRPRRRCSCGERASFSIGGGGAYACIGCLLVAVREARAAHRRFPTWETLKPIHFHLQSIAPLPGVACRDCGPTGPEPEWPEPVEGRYCDCGAGSWEGVPHDPYCPHGEYAQWAPGELVEAFGR